MQGFSFQIDEDENWSSRSDFFLLLRSNFDFKHSLDAEMHQDYTESNGTRIDALNTENLMDDRGPLIPQRRTSFKNTKMKRGCGMKGRFAMDGSDRMSLDRNDTSLNRR